MAHPRAGLKPSARPRAGLELSARPHAGLELSARPRAGVALVISRSTKQKSFESVHKQERYGKFTM